MCNRILHYRIHVSIPAPLRFGHCCNWETPQPLKWIRTGNINQFHFYVPEKIIEPAKKIKKKKRNIKENLNKTVNIIQSLNIVKSTYKKCLKLLVIGRARYKEVSSRG